MPASLHDTVLVGTEALPIALGANASATDVFTWTHNAGRKAVKVLVLDAVTRQPAATNNIAPGVTLVGKCVNVTTNSTTVLAITNQSTIAQDVILEVTFERDSASLGAAVLASAGVLS